MGQKENIRYISPEEQGAYLTLKEAAELTDYTPDYIGQLIRAGKIEGFQVYTNVSWVTTEKAVRAYMEGRGKGETKEGERSGLLANPHTFVRVALYGVIGCLIFILLAMVYIVSVSIDRAVTDASLQEFDARSRQ